MAALHLIIRGKVQGVFYRVSAKKIANKIGIVGWVRNTKEGNVEIIAQGPDSQTHEFVQWCRSGPPGATVQNITTEMVEEQDFDSFQILH